MEKRIDKLWSKYSRLSNRRLDIRQGKASRTYCGGCYKCEDRTADNEGYSGCCNEPIIAKDEAIDHLSFEIVEVLDEIDKELEKLKSDERHPE